MRETFHLVPTLWPYPRIVAPRPVRTQPRQCG